VGIYASVKKRPTVEGSVLPFPFPVLSPLPACPQTFPFLSLPPFPPYSSLFTLLILFFQPQSGPQNSASNMGRSGVWANPYLRRHYCDSLNPKSVSGVFLTGRAQSSFVSDCSCEARFYVGAGGSCPPPQPELCTQCFGYSSSVH